MALEPGWSWRYLELLILLPLPPTCWGHIYVSTQWPHLRILLHWFVWWEIHVPPSGLALHLLPLPAKPPSGPRPFILYRKLSPEPRFKNVLKSLTPSSFFLLWIKGGCLNLPLELWNAGKALCMVKTSLVRSRRFWSGEKAQLNPQHWF